MELGDVDGSLARDLRQRSKGYSLAWFGPASALEPSPKKFPTEADDGRARRPTPIPYPGPTMLLNARTTAAQND